MRVPVSTSGLAGLSKVGLLMVSVQPARGLCDGASSFFGKFGQDLKKTFEHRFVRGRACFAWSLPCP